MTQDIGKEKTEVKISDDTVEDGLASSLLGVTNGTSPYEFENTAGNLVGLDLELSDSIGVCTSEIRTDGTSLDINTAGSAYTCNSSSGITWSPNYGGTWGGSTTITVGAPNTYKVFNLPREDEMPEEVYACGRLLTLGLIGTDVECAFLGDKLLFEPGLLNALMIHNRLTLSVKYSDATYHYNLIDSGIQAIEGDLVSTVKRGKERKRRRKKK